MQRMLDILLSAFAIFLFSPILVVVIIVLFFTGEGEIFYFQKRVGLNGKLFRLYKFATMKKNSSKFGTATITINNDPRILPVGHFLRMTKINEIPQLINIILGHMSLVGPRPQSLRCFNAFLHKHKKIIIRVRPGLSGLGSVIFRNEESYLQLSRNPIDFYDHTIAPYKGELEAWYISHRSILNYFLIIILTVWVVFFKKSNLVWKLFHSIPKPPKKLRSFLNYGN